MSDLAAELDFALSLADAADAVTLPRFAARNFTVDLKANQTEVTEVDRGTETVIMDIIRTQRPHHAWYGEEHGSSDDASSSEYTWVIDPIDGTSNFVRGVPVWATLIALVHRDMGPVLGVVSAPAMHTRWWGVLEDGAYCNGHPISVSDVASLSEAHLSITANDLWDKIGKTQHIDNVTRAAKRVRGFGDFWQHMLVAQGAVDVAVDAVGLEPYDIAALIPIVQAAGGRLTNRKGVVDWRANTAISSNGAFHDDIIAMLTA
jgi:histidinol-phosphatase